MAQGTNMSLTPFWEPYYRSGGFATRCQDTFGCKMLWKALLWGYPARSHCQCPVLFSGEVYYIVLRISLVIDCTMPPEFWAESVTAGMCACFA